MVDEHGRVPTLTKFYPGGQIGFRASSGKRFGGGGEAAFTDAKKVFSSGVCYAGTQLRRNIHDHVWREW